MADQHLGIAIIGCGLISKFHLTAIKEIPEYKVKGVWDALPQAAANIAQTFGTKAYPALSDLLNDPEVDIVDICLPSGLHAEYGCQVAQANKHVIVEKPIEISMEAAQRLIKTCHTSKVTLSVILQNRFIPSVAKVKQAVDNGKLGRLIAGEACIKWFRDESYYQSSKWKGTKQLDGGGALINQSIHTIDLLLWFMGEVKALTSLVRTARHQIEVEDLAMALLEFKNGAIGTITGSTALKPGYPERIELYGEKGSIALEVGRIVRWQIDGEKEETHLDQMPTNSGSADPAAISADNHRSQLAAIANAILSGQQPPISGEEATKSLELILDIYQANQKWIIKK